MKKILLFAFTAFFTVAASAQTSQSVQSIKFGHVDFNQLIQLMPEMDSARVKLAAASKETQDTYDSMLAEFQTKAQEYQNKNATWTPAVKQIKETQLNDIQNRIKQFESSASDELQQQKEILMQPIYKKAQDVVSGIAKAKNLIVLFDSSSVLYIDDKQTVDLTQEARKALNIPEGRTLESLQKELQAQQAAQQPVQQQ